MVGRQVDYETVYQNLPIPVLLLDPEFIIVDANTAYLEVSGRTREALLGKNIFDAFPDNPADPDASGVQDLSGSLGRVLTKGKTDALSMQKYDVEVPGYPGLYATRYWCPVNAPVFGPDGKIELIAHCVEEITDRVRRFVEGLTEGAAREAE
jgi:PAS domain-containing protein